MIAAARNLCESLSKAVAPLAPFVIAGRRTEIGEIARATVEALENLARNEKSSVAPFYSGERGEQLAAFCAVWFQAKPGLISKLRNGQPCWMR